MSTLEIVKKAYDAWDKKDVKALRQILHEDYSAKIPGGMEIIGIEGAEKCLESCPFDSVTENETYIVEGDRVVRIWDMVTRGEHSFTLRMAELNVVKDGKVIFNEAFFDTRSFPQEIQKTCEEMMEKMKKTPAPTAGN